MALKPRIVHKEYGRPWICEGLDSIRIRIAANTLMEKEGEPNSTYTVVLEDGTPLLGSDVPKSTVQFLFVCDQYVQYKDYIHSFKCRWKDRMNLMQLRQGQTFYCVSEKYGQVQELFVRGRPRLEQGMPVLNCDCRLILSDGKPHVQTELNHANIIFDQQPYTGFGVTRSRGQAIRWAREGIR